ncbi:hypothetical protein LARI1_G001994 [Lachnellula arida]|uniref:Uncharacterized protein n=1 Tax=Lachnellula arida TaxID=1316785 RepID=A0A8T9BEG7_9HELO|nr:hypothetical protein LARI1_G001994 [Lachnellula arida]
MPPQTHIISRTLDPLFALAIGLGAAATRINREEKEAGRSTKETVDNGLREGGGKGEGKEKERERERGCGKERNLADLRFRRIGFPRTAVVGVEKKE